MMKRMYKKAVLFFITIISLLCIIFPLESSSALTRSRNDIDLSNINLYQFALRQENMEILSQNGSVVKDVVPANGNWKNSTVFSLKVDKTKENQDFSEPLALKFTNAGTVYDKVVDVYITVNSVTTHLASKNDDYNNSAKTVVPFLTVDEINPNNGLYLSFSSYRHS